MKAVSPDLIISDITMPEMNGYEFFDAVRARPEGITIPFIFLTARGERDDVMKGKNLGAEDYLVKPVTRSELVNAVQSRLTRISPAPNGSNGVGLSIHAHRPGEWHRSA